LNRDTPIFEPLDLKPMGSRLISTQFEAILLEGQLRNPLQIQVVLETRVRGSLITGSKLEKSND
jgi:hypothetical protein